MMKRLISISFLAIVYATGASTADLPPIQVPGNAGQGYAQSLPTFKGRVAVIDGRTLWYPQGSIKVRLASIDACELPQWSFDARRSESPTEKTLRPVPCGPLARAWLKRTVGNASVQCRGVAFGVDGVLEAQCDTRGHDLSLEMLRVGWAHTQPYVTGPYAEAQRYAMSARYGMWATYVLDMPEWREKAVDRTLARRPLADLNLLLERRSEISPPFADARRLPTRTDR